jgi:sphinganine-1-phosphate aldolase
MVVGLAPAFPHGVIDPIPQIAALAAERRWAVTSTSARAGSSCRRPSGSAARYRPFDFPLPGVSSMSADRNT